MQPMEVLEMYETSYNDQVDLRDSQEILRYKT